jgi:hypothetical protein
MGPAPLSTVTCKGNLYSGKVLRGNCTEKISRNKHSPIPAPHRSASIPSTKFHSRKFLFSHNPLHQIFPKTISPEIFPGTFTKNLSDTRDERTVRDFPKMPHRIFREDSCIQSSRHAADPASKPLLALFFRSPLVTVSHSPNFSHNNFARNFSRDFHKKSFRKTR